MDDHDRLVALYSLEYQDPTLHDDVVIPSSAAFPCRRRFLIVSLRRIRILLGPLSLLLLIAAVTPRIPSSDAAEAEPPSSHPRTAWIGSGEGAVGVSWDVGNGGNSGGEGAMMDVRYLNSTLFNGGPPAVFVGGRWCVFGDEGEGDEDESLPRNGRGDSIFVLGEDEVLGPFRAIEVRWSCPLRVENDEDEASVTPVVATIKIFASDVLFELHFPEGASGTSIVDPDDPSSHDGVMAHFPTLRPSSPKESSMLSWEGSFVHSVRRYPVGPIGGGPTVFYDEHVDPWLQTVVVGGPWDGSTSFKAFSSGNGTLWNGTAGYWTLGTSGRIEGLPKGYRQTILLHFGRDGITSALYEWGAAMRQSRALRRSGERSVSSQGRTAPGGKSKTNETPGGTHIEKLRDITLEKIGYQTDNGAYYCFCNEKNCSDTLLRTVECLRDQNITLGYLSFQGKGTSTSSFSSSPSSDSEFGVVGRKRLEGGSVAPWCIGIWGADDGGLGPRYPVPLREFQLALGLPLQLYAPYFCPRSPYFGDGNEGDLGKWTSVLSDSSLPRCEGFHFRNVEPTKSKEFYDWFLRKGTVVGMTSFETDFMNQNHNCVPGFIHEVGKVTKWLSGMAEAAETLDVPIQWCNAAPTDVVASIDMPAVTNFRVSDDYCYGSSWNIGESSLLIWAVGGAAPSKDTLWTTENDGMETHGCKWTPDHASQAAELHLMLSLMSTGPVGISDGMGMTNATLLRKAISQDGTLLKPSRPITAVDSTFFSEDVGGVPMGSFVYSTSGVADSSWYFVSFKLKQPHSVRLCDFWPNIFKSKDRKVRSTFLVHRRFDGGVGCVDGKDAVESGCVNVTILPQPRGDDAESSNSQGKVVFCAPKSSFNNVTGGSDLSPMLTTVWRACRDTGWVLLGELSKYVSLSPARFLTVRCLHGRKTSSSSSSLSPNGGGLLAQVVGSPGEVVTVTALRPERGQNGGGGRVLGLSLVVVRRSVMIPAGGEPAWIEFDGKNYELKKAA